ncbi:hypothetical protein VRRI112168_09445 [Vreelandella rituensis]|uniref:Uncharacterized protein n=1 Tax=Vreelandella rituensis TaxID=2282306 RepID=A0A368U3A4_9GAMM|nr:hypothetical protein [Halomonas rituensis]RCV91494.1 hypothetical protein DU506_10175 [Halomonas rituensis]
MTDQSIRVDLADGSSWYFPSEITTAERADLVLSHILATLKEIELNYDNARNIADDQRHQLLKKLTHEMDFVMGLFEEVA